MHVVRQLLHGVPGHAAQRSRKRRAFHLGGGEGQQRAFCARFSKLAIPFIPNNPPRWPEVVDAVVNIVDVYARNARKYERVGEWIDRIGWPKFFELTGIEFTRYHIDDFKNAGLTFARSAHLRF